MGTYFFPKPKLPRNIAPIIFWPTIAKVQPNIFNVSHPFLQVDLVKKSTSMNVRQIALKA